MSIARVYGLQRALVCPYIAGGQNILRAQAGAALFFGSDQGKFISLTFKAMATLSLKIYRIPSLVITSSSIGCAIFPGSWCGRLHEYLSGRNRISQLAARTLASYLSAPWLSGLKESHG